MEDPALHASRPPIRLGMLTPSSNSVLEPVCAAILAGLPDVSAHFARFRVTEISLSARAKSQFATAAMLAAATQLVDARVDALCWNGTSAGWLGLDRDRKLCAEITRATGIPATSAVLALLEALRQAGIARIGLVSPYSSDVQARIAETFAAEGITILAERHLGLSENFTFATVPADTIAGMIEAVAAAGPAAVVVLCTNLRAAPLAAGLERRLNIPILDSVATATWGALRLAGVAPERVTGWGRLFTGLG
jgi:maleate isomerase